MIVADLATGLRRSSRIWRVNTIMVVSSMNFKAALP